MSESCASTPVHTSPPGLLLTYPNMVCGDHSAGKPQGFGIMALPFLPGYRYRQSLRTNGVVEMDRRPIERAQHFYHSIIRTNPLPTLPVDCAASRSFGGRATRRNRCLMTTDSKLDGRISHPHYRATRLPWVAAEKTTPGMESKAQLYPSSARPKVNKSWYEKRQRGCGRGRRVCQIFLLTQLPSTEHRNNSRAA